MQARDERRAPARHRTRRSRLRRKSHRRRTRVDIPMLVLRAEWLKAIGFPIGAKAFLSTDKRGDITLTRMGLRRPRRLRLVKAKP